MIIMKILKLFIFLITIIINIYIYNVFSQSSFLKDDNKKYRVFYIKNYSLLSILIAFIVIICIFMNLKLQIITTKSFKQLYNLYFILGLVNLYLINLITRTNKNNIAKDNSNLKFHNINHNKNKDETLNDLVDSKYTILDSHYDIMINDINNEKILTPFVKMNYEKFRTYYDNKDDELVEQLKKQCELVLLNNR